MELELVILGQVLVFLAISFGTLMAALAPRGLQPVVRTTPRGVTSYVPNRGL